MRTFDEGWETEVSEAANCTLCGGTGYLQHGMVIRDHLTWVATLVACSHGVIANAAEQIRRALEASADGPSEIDTLQTVEVSSRVQRGRRGSDRAAQADGSPPASGGAT